MERKFSAAGVSRLSTLSEAEKGEFTKQLSPTVWFIWFETQLPDGVDKEMGNADQIQTWIGGGVCINSSGLILTAEHVTRGPISEEGKKIKIWGTSMAHLSSQPFQLVLVSRDSSNDLALLRVVVSDDDQKEFAYALISLPTFRLPNTHRMSTYCIHHHSPSVFSLSTGYIISTPDEEMPIILRYKNRMYPGSSGCPDFDATGRIIGIGTESSNDVVFSASVYQIRRFLANLQPKDGFNFSLEGEKFTLDIDH